MSTSILESTPTSVDFLRGPTSPARPGLRSLACPFVRSLACSLARALVSILRMGLVGTLCVGSAEKRVRSIPGTGGSQVLSYLWWGVLPDGRRILSLATRKGLRRRGLGSSTLSSHLFLLSCPHPSYSPRVFQAPMTNGPGHSRLARKAVVSCPKKKDTVSVFGRKEKENTAPGRLGQANKMRSNRYRVNWTQIM